MTQEHPETVDRVTGEREAAEELAKVYHNLHTCAGSIQGMYELQDKIKHLLQSEESKL